MFDAYPDYNSIGVMMKFTETLKENPNKAYDIICNYSGSLSKDKLEDIIKEILYSLHYHIDNSFYGNLYSDILSDVQIELDEKYDEEYQEYNKWLEAVNN